MSDDVERQLAEQAAEMDELREQAAALEDEVVGLRRRLQDAPKRVRTLEERLLETKGQLSQAVTQNEKLTYTLREAREHIAALREEVDKLTQPPAAYGTVLGVNEDDDTVDVFSGGRKMRVAAMPDELGKLRRGDEVALNESFSVILSRASERTGEVVTIKTVMTEGRVLIVGRADEERVCEVLDEVVGAGIRVGDTVLMDSRSGLVVEKIDRPEVEELVLEEVPDISYDDVGGLDSQIEAIADAVELPFVHHELFAEHKLPAPKGILLYGPPGCGKTLIAKAVANSLAKKVAEVSGDGQAKSYFLNIKGPELLNKYVGETERQIRLVFQRAREKSEEGWPVIVFFDEMDSMFRTRGTGISSDMESTIVPQLLAEIDGVETLKNVIVIGAMKAGTTSMHNYLDVHPEIAVSTEKEMRFFSDPGAADWVGRYQQHFPEGTRLRVESSPHYTKFPVVPGVVDRMAELTPDARLIYLVRDPVERLVAEYVEQVQWHAAHRSLDEEIADAADPAHALMASSRYATQLTEVRRRFPAEQVLVLDLADLGADVVGTMVRVFAFLGLDAPDATAEDYGRHNTREEKYQVPGWLLRLRRGPLLRAFRKLPAGPRRMVSMAAWRRSSNLVERPTLTPETEARLRELLAPEARRLRELTGQPFASWSV